jgi:hypothetical protein
MAIAAGGAQRKASLEQEMAAARYAGAPGRRSSRTSCSNTLANVRRLYGRRRTGAVMLDNLMRSWRIARARDAGEYGRPLERDAELVESIPACPVE